MDAAGSGGASANWGTAFPAFGGAAAAQCQTVVAMGRGAQGCQIFLFPKSPEGSNFLCFDF